MQNRIRWHERTGSSLTGLYQRVHFLLTCGWRSQPLVLVRLRGSVRQKPACASTHTTQDPKCPKHCTYRKQIGKTNYKPNESHVAAPLLAAERPRQMASAGKGAPDELKWGSSGEPGCCRRTLCPFLTTEVRRAWREEPRQRIRWSPPPPPGKHMAALIDPKHHQQCSSTGCLYLSIELMLLSEC